MDPNTIAAVARVILFVFALRGSRLAYGAFFVLSIAYFPIKSGFELDPQRCRTTIDLALSFSNYAHMVLFAVFFIFSYLHFRSSGWKTPPFLPAAIMTLLMGMLVEIAQGLTATGNCRVRDLISDSIGAILGALVVITVRRIARTG